MSVLSSSDWRDSLQQVVELVREMSLQTDPQAMVRTYAKRIQTILPVDGRMSLSRRGLQAPQYRITRSTHWTEEVNPWKEKHRLPLFDSGLLSDLIYRSEAVIISDLNISPHDPAAEYLRDYRSLMAIPMFDQGESLNMVVSLRREPNGFVREELPTIVWLSNLFGRATNNLVLAEELQQTYRKLDHELRVVADIQRSLLPASIPKIPTLDIATYYQPAAHSGGDYYDFFPLPDNNWGIFIGDVSGHGTPAAVMMAITHCIAHMHPGPVSPPADVMDYLNRQLFRLYTGQNSQFITAFYGVYNPATRKLRYACAGHNPPRVKRCADGTLFDLDQADGIPLGIFEDSKFSEADVSLESGDQIIFYTDGITEANNPHGQMFGTERLDRVLENCALQASSLLETVLTAVNDFVQGVPADDDRTVVVARVT
jgi:sigma-B regulation protein RsbU (phosphoserine phosphatase)